MNCSYRHRRSFYPGGGRHRQEEWKVIHLVAVLVAFADLVAFLLADAKAFACVVACTF
jgi:hypothetical protein